LDNLEFWESFVDIHTELGMLFDDCFDERDKGRIRVLNEREARFWQNFVSLEVLSRDRLFVLETLETSFQNVPDKTRLTSSNIS
jgi:hypothetical protein